jgi:hypothetical protein
MKESSELNHIGHIGMLLQYPKKEVLWHHMNISL